MEVLSLEAAIANGLLTKLCQEISAIVWSDAGMMETRIQNCMHDSGRKFVWEMACEKEDWLKKTKNYGRRCHVYVQDTFAKLGLAFGMRFAPDLCDEIERITGEKRPKETPVPNAPVERPKTITQAEAFVAPLAPAVASTSELRKFADVIAEIKVLGKKRLAEIDEEVEILHNVCRALEYEFGILIGNVTHPAVKAFFEECGGTPTWEQVDARRKSLVQKGDAIRSAFKMYNYDNAIGRIETLAKILDHSPS